MQQRFAPLLNSDKIQILCVGLQNPSSAIPRIDRVKAGQMGYLMG